jgi:hypothetical protein
VDAISQLVDAIPQGSELVSGRIPTHYRYVLSLSLRYSLPVHLVHLGTSCLTHIHVRTSPSNCAVVANHEEGANQQSSHLRCGGGQVLAHQSGTHLSLLQEDHSDKGGCHSLFVLFLLLEKVHSPRSQTTEQATTTEAAATEKAEKELTIFGATTTPTPISVIHVTHTHHSTVNTLFLLCSVFGKHPLPAAAAAPSCVTLTQQATSAAAGRTASRPELRTGLPDLRGGPALLSPYFL